MHYVHLENWPRYGLLKQNFSYQVFFTEIIFEPFYGRSKVLGQDFLNHFFFLFIYFFVHLMVAIDRHQGNFSKCLHYNCILVTAIAVSKTRLVGTRIHCIRPSQVPSLGKRFYLLSFCTEPFFLEDTLSILINTTLLPILSSVPLHWPSNRLFWFTFISQFFLVHENLSRVPEYKISPNNILGGKISGKNNKGIRLSFCTEHYLDHRIQQPISKLRMLFFLEFMNQSYCFWRSN